MSSRSVDDEGGKKSSDPRQRDDTATLADISMEDTDAAAQRIPEGLLDEAAKSPGKSPDAEKQESSAGESFSGAPTITPSTLLEEDLPDFPELASVDPDSYVFGAEIARGGMGRILSARDRRTGRHVAIKEILPPLMASISAKEKDGLVARFQREAHVTARLEHPSIVPVYEIGTFEGRPFFAMKKVDGVGLDELIKARATLAERFELLPTIVSLAEALAYAHGERVIHRDLKSSNILVGAFGETVVIDWGLAKDLSSDDDARDDPIAVSTSSSDSVRPLQTVAGSIFGTPHYMPPEQARGKVVDERADVYAIGSILYHLLSGKAPYQDSETEVPSGSLLRKIREEPPRPLDSIVSDVPRDLLSIVDKAMSRDKSQRYPSAAELATDLADFTAGQRVGVHQYSNSELLSRWLKRHKTAVATGVILLAALLVTISVSMLSIMESRDKAERNARKASEQKERADKSTDDAMRFLAERGRIDFLGDRPLQGLLLLAKAYQHLEDRPASKLMMAAAMRSIDALQKTFDPHHSAISSLTASQDRTKLVSTGIDGEVRIWNMESGTLISSFGEESKWSGVVPSLNRDGSKIAIPGEGGVSIWSTATGERVASIDGNFVFATYDYRDRIITFAPDGEVAAWTQPSEAKVTLYKLPRLGPMWNAKISGDGKSLVVGHNQIFILDLVKNELRAKAMSHTSKLVAIDTSTNSTRFATGLGGVVTVWDLHSLEKVSTLNINGSLVKTSAITFSPDGTLLATAAPNQNIQVYDVESGKRISSFASQEATLHRIMFAPDGKRLVTMGHSEIVRIWDVDTGRLRSAFIGQSKSTTATVFSADGNSLFIGDSSGGITKWDASSDVVAHEYPGPSSYTAEDPTGRRLLGSTATGVALLDSQSLEVITTLGPASQLNVARFSQDGNRILTGGRIYDSSDGSLVRDLGVNAEAAMMTGMNSDGSVVAMSSATSVRVWSVETGALLYETPDTDLVLAPIWLSPDSNYLLAILGDSRLTMIEIPSGKRHQHFEYTGVSRDYITFLAKPNHVVINNYPEGLDVVDVTTGETLKTVDGRFTSISPAPDGVRILAASGNSAILWNAETGEVETTMKDHLAISIFSTTASRDGHFLALASHNSVSVYDRETGVLIRRMSLGNETVQSLVFGPSDDSLVVGARNRALVLDIHREVRPSATIEQLVRERVSTILEHGTFLPASPSRSTRGHGRLPNRRLLFTPPKSDSQP